MRRVGRQPCPAIPAAGVEPAAFSFSGRRSYRPSYTGIQETPAGVEPASRSGCSRPREPSGPTSSGNKSRRWDSNPLHPRYEGGARPVEHRRPIRAASAGVEPTRPEFRAPVPSRGPGRKKIQSQWRDSNPHAPLYRRGARPVELHWRCRTRVDSRLRSGAATVTGSHAASAFSEPVGRAGVEPANRAS